MQSENEAQFSNTSLPSLPVFAGSSARVTVIVPLASIYASL